jgi:hypothetical protein
VPTSSSLSPSTFNQASQCFIQLFVNAVWLELFMEGSLQVKKPVVMYQQYFFDGSAFALCSFNTFLGK